MPDLTTSTRTFNRFSRRRSRGQFLGDEKCTAPPTQLGALRSNDFLALVRKHRPWFVPREAAAYLHVSIRTLESWRALGTGSVFTKRKNGFIRYHIDGVDAFMAADPD